MGARGLGWRKKQDESAAIVSVRVTQVGAPWILRLWCNTTDLETLSKEHRLVAKSDRGDTIEVRVGETRVPRLARTGDQAARFHLPPTTLEALLEGDRREVKAVNGALPLSVTLTLDWGIGLPQELANADLTW